MRGNSSVFSNVLAAIGALILVAACSAENRPHAFDAIPVDLTHPPVPEGGVRSPEFIEFQLRIFEDLGSWPPNYFQATERVLRDEGRQVEANAVRVFSAIRRDTLDQICGVPKRGLAPTERYVLLLENLVSYSLSGRPLEKLKEAVELAEMLDDTHRWQFRPQIGRCTAFKVKATSPPTLALKNQAEFWRTHDKNRAMLRSAFNIVRRAAEKGLEQNQTPFAFGMPLEYQSTETINFLKHFKPVEVIEKFPDMYGSQSVHALEHGGRSLIVMEQNPYGKIARYHLDSSAIKQLERPDGFLVSEFSKEVIFARAYVSSCSETNSPCERADLVVEVRSELRNRITEFNHSISLNGSQLERLFANLAGISEDQALAFVWLTGTRAPPQTSGPQLTGWSRSPNARYAELILIDLAEAKILLRLNAAEAGKFTLSGFSTGELNERRFLLGIIDDNSARSELRVEEYALNGARLGEIPIEHELLGQRFPIGFLSNLSRGYDVSRLVASCHVCEAIGQTPDGRYWIVSRSDSGRPMIELWDVETNTRVAKISHGWGKVSWRSYDIESGRIVVPMGGEHQIYNYVKQ